MNVSIEKKIKIATIVADVQLSDLAKKIGITTQAMYSRMKTGNFELKEFEAMANYMCCKFVCKLVLPDGSEVKNDDYFNSFGKIVKRAYKMQGLTTEYIGDKFGTTKQNISAKLNTKFFSVDDLQKYADAINCKMVVYFDFGEDQV